MNSHFQHKIAGLLLLVLLVSACGQEESVRLYFAGDLMLDRGVRHQIEKHGAEWILEDVDSLFQSADFALANLECPVTEPKSPIHKKYSFRGEPAWLPALKNAGLSHLVMANNHSNDQGREGMIETGKNLEKNKLKPIGYGATAKSACQPVELKKGERTLAVFASVLLPLETWMPLTDRPGVCQQSPEEIAESIRKYRKVKPEALILVSLHWGVEYHRQPTATQRKGARTLIAAGADGIIGHHPHVIQQMEWMEGKPVIYSLGNFVFDTKREDARQGILLELNWGIEPEWKLHPYKVEDSRPIRLKGKDLQDFWEEMEGLLGKPETYKQKPV